MITLADTNLPRTVANMHMLQRAALNRGLEMLKLSQCTPIDIAPKKGKVTSSGIKGIHYVHNTDRWRVYYKGKTYPNTYATIDEANEVLTAIINLDRGLS